MKKEAVKFLRRYDVKHSCVDKASIKSCDSNINALQVLNEFYACKVIRGAHIIILHGKANMCAGAHITILHGKANMCAIGTCKWCCCWAVVVLVTLHTSRTSMP